tara:strand:- start:2169 stop:2405 length:237 start_codon:yes stop_codon:yes gene_type:complete
MVTDELNELSDEELFEMLDKKSAQLKESAKPLMSYQTKRYAAISTLVSGIELSDDMIDKAQDIGNDNEREFFKKIDGF